MAAGSSRRVKQRARAQYDYILIDSRTGVSDTAGICSVQMPDTLVVCFTYNNQSIKGASAVARSAGRCTTSWSKKSWHSAERQNSQSARYSKDYAIPYRVFPGPDARGQRRERSAGNAAGIRPARLQRFD